MSIGDHGKLTSDGMGGNEDLAKVNLFGCLDKQNRTRQRPDWDTYFMRIARITSERSTCSFRAVGCIFVNSNHRILVGGYNGSPHGEPHCCEGNQLLDTDGETCIRCLHAEKNGLIQAARHGTSIIGCTLYTTYRPCRRCTPDLIAVGIKRIVYLGGSPEPELIERYRRAGVILLNLTSKGYTDEFNQT